MTQTIELPTPGVRPKAAAGITPDRQMYRLIDLQASAEAAAALHAAASRAREKGGLLADVLASADAILAGALTRSGLPMDDSAARTRLRDAILSDGFAPLLMPLMRELREAASARPDSGACTIATALKLWSWTLKYLREDAPANVVDELGEALCPLLAARSLALEMGAESAESLRKETELRRDLAHVYAARASAQAGTTCAELVFGYRRHLLWDAEGCATCFDADSLDDLEAIMPGFASGARTSFDIIESDGSHPKKAGPCAKFDGLETFMRLRNRLDACLTGARFAKDRAAVTMTSRPTEGRA